MQTPPLVTSALADIPTVIVQTNAAVAKGLLADGIEGATDGFAETAAPLPKSRLEGTAHNPLPYRGIEGMGVEGRPPLGGIEGMGVERLPPLGGIEGMGVERLPPLGGIEGGRKHTVLTVDNTGDKVTVTVSIGDALAVDDGLCRGTQHRPYGIQFFFNLCDFIASDGGAGITLHTTGAMTHVEVTAELLCQDV
jgi:hypothetical protein